MAETGGEGISEPLSPALRATLRRAVREHARSGQRRLAQPVVHVGTPGGSQRLFAVLREEPTDHGLRVDIVAAMLHAATREKPEQEDDAPLVWLTRAGDLDTQDVDMEWLAAARQAYAEAGVPLRMVVVNRHGWRDPRSGVGQSWVRVRPE